MEHNTFQRVFPERVSIPVVDTRVGIASINSMSGSDTGIKGLIGEKSIIDAIEMYPDHFFRHEEVHIVNEVCLNSRFDITKEKRSKLRKNYFEYRNTLPVLNDRRSAFESAYFIVTHELNNIHSFTNEGGNSKRLVDDEVLQLIRDPGAFVIDFLYRVTS
ncbi:MAG: hypothetical protein J0M15_02150 [Deltaproteobacteria bacterium]|nr:hypothetical protein [Deltaproteobacteria bacterium]